jgi:organic radical activating enzyme
MQMPDLFESIRNLFEPIDPIKPGVYHYQAPQDDPRNYRLHLRIEQDGSGVLIVNAATVLHLNRTAAEYAYYLVKDTPRDQAVRSMASRYRVSRDQALRDYQELVDRIETLIETPDLDPVTYLGFERRMPYSGKIIAPYRLDCALTYKLPEGVDPKMAPTSRVTEELSTEQWKVIIDKAWQNGIPHIVFTGGEPTLREDLVQLIQHTEDNGQVSGLLSDGHRLVDGAYLNDLLMTGLDHLMLILQPEIENSWTALQNALAEDIYTAVHLTLTHENQEEMAQYLNKCADMGVPAVSLSAISRDLDSALQEAQDLTTSRNMELVWDLPVPYSTHNPVALEVEEHELPEGAGRAWLYVEPDGDVTPSQGDEQVLGNMLSDPWARIWTIKE